MPDKIIVYNPSSFGGTYDYILQLLPSLRALGVPVEIWMPSNAPTTVAEGRKHLLADRIEGGNIKKRFYFLWRSLISPLKFWTYIRTQPNALVLFNDYDQITIPFWVPLYKATKAKGQVFAVELHDPDRDEFPPSLGYSQRTMLMLMDIMDIGIYHEILSDRLYYKQSHTRYASVPFGEYAMAPADSAMVQQLVAARINPADPSRPFVLAGINGNIRPEKNYDLAIKALPHHPDLKLIIAGRAANSGVDTNLYRNLATELGVADRIIWLERFLSDEELSAVLETTDIILLAYSASFKSQSAIFASLIPFSSNLVASEGENAMAKAVRNYNLGELVTPDDLESLVEGIGRAKQYVGTKRPGWSAYKAANSWTKNAETIWGLAKETNQ